MEKFGHASRAESTQRSGSVTQIEDWIDSMESWDVEKLGRQLENLGKKNPLLLALAALSIGMAAGVLLRRKVPSTSRD